MTDEQQTTTQPDDTLEAAQQRVNEFEAKWKRALADYQNREKDIARERAEFAQFCAADVVRDFLPIVDAIAAANVHPPAPPLPEGGGKIKEDVEGKKNFSPSPMEGERERLSPSRRGGAGGGCTSVQGVGRSNDFSFLHRLCLDFLKRHGVEPVGAVGDHVDYLLHEVVGTETKKTPGVFLEAGVILEVVQVGYMMYGRLLRPAKVIIQGEITNDEIGMTNQ